MLSSEEKAARKRDRMIATARQYTIGSVRRQVAKTFQRMIRAEYGADASGLAFAVVQSEFQQVFRPVGWVACVTCGSVHRWCNGKQINTGHFIAGRSNAILFEETNVAPQCVHCNKYRSGAQSDYRVYAENVHGLKAIERLERLRRTTVKFSKDELVDKKIRYLDRLKAAQESMSVARS